MARRAKADLAHRWTSPSSTFSGSSTRGNRGTIRSHYKELTRKILDFNNREKNPKAFLRQPQYEALEIYVFLKELMGNAKVEEIFKDWFEKKGRFADRKEGGLIGNSGQGSLFDIGDAGTVQGSVQHDA